LAELKLPLQWKTTSCSEAELQGSWLLLQPALPWQVHFHLALRHTLACRVHPPISMNPGKYQTPAVSLLKHH
jgi:hypothetical protein